jgi:hypothetical protein
MKNNWKELGPDEMAIEIQALSERLKRKTEDLSRARFRLRKAKVEITRLKEIVSYQRTRIVELHE